MARARMSRDSVRSTSLKVDSVGAYAIEAPMDGRSSCCSTSTPPARRSRSRSRAGSRAVGLYRFTSGTPWGPAGTANLASGAVALALPARSATLAVVAPGTTAAGGPLGAPGLQLRCAPNPMRENATLSFTLANDGGAELTLFDLAGRRVRTLASGPRTAGTHRVRWDGLDARGRLAPSGVYLCRLRVPGSEQVVRVLRVQ